MLNFGDSVYFCWIALVWIFVSRSLIWKRREQAKSGLIEMHGQEEALNLPVAQGKGRVRRKDQMAWSDEAQSSAVGLGSQVFKGSLVLISRHLVFWSVMPMEVRLDLNPGKNGEEVQTGSWRYLAYKRHSGFCEEFMWPIKCFDSFTYLKYIFHKEVVNL